MKRLRVIKNKYLLIQYLDDNTGMIFHLDGPHCLGLINFAKRLTRKEAKQFLKKYIQLRTDPDLAPYIEEDKNEK